MGTVLSSTLTLDQIDGSNSALNIEGDCCGRFPVGGVDVIVVFLGQAISADGADSAGGVNLYANVFG